MNKSTFKALIQEILHEELTKMEEESQAAKDAKSQGLVSMGFGRWGKKGGPITHSTQSGKLVPLKSMNQYKAAKTKAARPAPGDRSPQGQRNTNMTRPEKDAKFGAIGSTGTDAGNRIVSKVIDKFSDTSDKLLDKYEYYDDIPADEFTSVTGIPKKAAVWTAQNNDDYEQPFSYNAESDTFSINDPYDI